MAASGPSPYADARLFRTRLVTIRKPDWSNSPTPTPKTGFSTVGERVNHRGARLTLSLCRWSQKTKYATVTTFERPIDSATPATPQCSTRMNKTSNTRFATVDAMSPIIA